MNNLDDVTKLKLALKQLQDEDLVAALFLMEMDIELNSFKDFQYALDRELMRIFIEKINTIKELGEIRQIILNYYTSQKWEYIDDYNREVENLKTRLKNRGKDLLKYKNDPRLLDFALSYYNAELGRENRNIKNIKNSYFRLLFIIHCHPDYCTNTRKLETIEEKYSSIINKHLVHFVKNDTYDFYRWAKNYMDQNEKYYSTIYAPTTDEEYRTTVNIIFDKLLNENEDIYTALKDRLSNAWYQKLYRQKHKGKKPCHYVLTKDAQEALRILAFKDKITEDQVIENLINKRYADECRDAQGIDRYNLSVS